MILNHRSPVGGHSKEGGHNLLEVMIAGFIFSTLLVLTIGTWGLYHKAITKSKNVLLATSLGQQVLEERLAGGYESLTPYLAAPSTQVMQLDSMVRGRRLKTEFNVTFQAIDVGTVPGFRKLQVDVVYQEATGTHTVKYEAYLYRSS